MPDIFAVDQAYVTENIEWVWHPEIVIYESVIVSESPEYAPDRWSLSAVENIAVLIDIVSLGFTPKYINVQSNIVIVDIALPPDLSEVGINVDDISVVEAVMLEKEFGFNDLLRGYPFTTRIKTGVKTVEFENGVVQERDLWGRNQKVFEITFPPLSKAEAMDVMAFYENTIGQVFAFTNPIDSITYQVRIMDKEFIMERRYFGIYFARITVSEEM